MKLTTLKGESFAAQSFASLGQFAVSAIALGAFTTTAAYAHVGVLNTALPFAVAGKSYELNLTIPHGCEPDPTTKLDTYKVKVEIPAGFTGVRPLMDGLFGKVSIAKDGAGNVTSLTWSKPASFDSASDDHTYRISLRGTAINKPFQYLQFRTTQYCKVAGNPDATLVWEGVNAPTVKVFPARVPGWNKFNVTADNEKHTPTDVKAFLKDFFSDASIVWVGNGAYSANPNTVTRIDKLILKNSKYSRLDADGSAAMIHADYDIWVKY